MPSRRLRFRPPGVKPWTRIGRLGPFRGRLGLAWVIAPLVVGVVLLIAVWYLLFRTAGPGDFLGAAGGAQGVGSLEGGTEASMTAENPVYRSGQVNVQRFARGA